MPNMSVAELLFALLLVCVLAATAVCLALIWSQGKRAEGHARELAELRAQLASGGSVQESHAAELRERMANTQAAMEGFRSALAARQQVEDEARSSLRRLENIISGSSTRGAAGENILDEALRALPPEMLQHNVWVGGKVVELGLRLPGGKILPIDSKWVSSGALEELAVPDLPASRRTQLTNSVEKEVERRVRDVSQYIDPAMTAPFALAAIPDAAYDICRAAIAIAHRRRVIVVGYSMALPYLLTLYQLHLQFARTVDLDNMQATLIDVERQLDGLEGVLENRLQRAVTMLQNAYGEGKQVSARIRALAHSMQVPEEGVDKVDPKPELALVEPVQ